MGRLAWGFERSDGDGDGDGGGMLELVLMIVSSD